MFIRTGRQGVGGKNGHCCLGVKELKGPCIELSIHRECLFHTDPGENQGNKFSCAPRAEVYNDGGRRDGDKQGIRVILLEGRAINGTGFYFGFIYKGVRLQFSGSGDGDQ